MKEKAIELIQKRIDYFESVILECLQDGRNESNQEVANANIRIIEMCMTNKLELDDLLCEIEKEL